MRCPGFEILLLGMAVAAHAAEPVNSSFFRNSDLPTVDIVQFEANGLARTALYRLTLSIVPIRSVDTGSFGSELGSTPRLTTVTERQKEIAWAPNANWTKFVGGDGSSWSPSMRLETKGERLDIRPRRHSLSIIWHKAFY